MSEQLRILFFTMANLNVIDGSSVWMHSVAETIHVDPRTRTTILLRAPETRDVITRGMHRLERVTLVDPRHRRFPDPSGLTVPVAIEALARLDREQPHDIVLLRAYDVCSEAVRQGHFNRRLWSCYILEPERDLSDPAYIAGMTRIAEASRYVVCQSEEMRALLESAVPAAIGKTILIAPGIPVDVARRPDPAVIVPRMIYAGKFHRFYPVHRMIEMLTELRRDHPDLEFHVAGDKFHRPKGDTTYANTLGRALSETPGVVWHGGIGRDDVEALVAQGGIALSLWDFDHGPGMNNLVISTKLLDFCSVGLPVILNRTAAQEDVLGVDYPLFVSRVDEALPLLRRLLDDPGLYRAASERTYEASRRFTYPSVHRQLVPYLDRLAAELEAPAATPPTVEVLGSGQAARAADALLRPLARVRVEQREAPGSASAAVILAEGAAGIAAASGAGPRPGTRVVAYLAATGDAAAAGPGLAQAAHVVAGDSAAAAGAVAAGVPAVQLSVIPTAVDDVQLARPKLPGAMFTIAVAGEPDERRLDMLERFAVAIAALDERFRVVGRGAPAGLDRPDPASARQKAVAWEPDDGDLPNWYRTVGFVVAADPDGQTSAALAPAVASGAVPVILGEAGAAAWLVGSEAGLEPEAAAARAVSLVRGGRFEEEVAAARALGATAGIAAVREAWLRVLA